MNPGQRSIVAELLQLSSLIRWDRPQAQVVRQHIDDFGVKRWRLPGLFLQTSPSGGLFLELLGGAPGASCLALRAGSVGERTGDGRPREPSCSNGFRQFPAGRGVWASGRTGEPSPPNNKGVTKRLQRWLTGLRLCVLPTLSASASLGFAGHDWVLRRAL